MALDLPSRLPSTLGWAYGGAGADLGPRVITAEILGLLGGGVGPFGPASVPGPTPALTALLTPSGGTRPTTLSSIFAALRALGVRPHPGAEDGSEDEAHADEIYTAWLSTAAGGGADAAVAPCPLVGIAEVTLARTTQATDDVPARPTGAGFQAANHSQRGTWAQELAEASLSGAGRLRKVRQCDVVFGSVFPVNEWDEALWNYGELVAPPSDLLAGIRADDYRRLSASTQAIVLACLVGVKLDLTPFNGGGGMRLNIRAPLGKDKWKQPTLDTAVEISSTEPSSTTWGDVVAGRPPWQTGCLLYSGFGWEKFYYVHSGVSGAEPSDAVRYQRFALNVWPTAEPGHDRTPERSAYYRECARRKSLATAAFAQGIGEWLAAIDGALRSVGVAEGVLTVVDRVELGNELDAYWDIYDTDHSPYEVGRYLALLAGPIAAAVPGMKFRHDLHDWTYEDEAAGGEDDFSARLAWMERVVGGGMVGETTWWQRVQREQVLQEVHDRGERAVGASESVRAWLTTCAEAGYQWPPPIVDLASPTEDLVEALEEHEPARATDLIHEVGTHWYHVYDHDHEGFASEDSYSPTNRLAADIRGLAALARVLAADGFSISPTVGEICWQAHDPGDPAIYAPWNPKTRSNQWGGKYYAYTSPLLQGAMYLRLVATTLAAGGASARIYTFAFGATEASTAYNPAVPGSYVFNQCPSWGSYSTSGLRNDVVTGHVAPVQEEDCWPRPAWYALQRLGWLLGLAGNGAAAAAPQGISLAYDADDVQVVEIRFVAPAYAGPDGKEFERGWRRAYLVWLDQKASASTAALSFTDAAGHGCEILPLVPLVVPDVGATGAIDANEYAALDPTVSGPNPDWEWAGWDAALASRSEGMGPLLLRVRRTNPDPTAQPTVIAPLCVLTNATLERVEV